MSAVDIQFDDILTVLHTYFSEPENQARIRRAVSNGIDSAEKTMLTDTKWRVPRHPDLRRNGFKNYLAPYRDQLVASMAQEMTHEFPDVLSRGNAQIAAQIAMSQAEPELQERFFRVLEQQIRFAVRGIALPWASDHFGDCCQLFLPIRDEKAKVWRLPVTLDASKPPRVYVVVNDDGDVISNPDDLLRDLQRG